MQGPFRVAVPAGLRFKGSLDDLIGWTFEGLSLNCHDHQWMAGRSIICPSNKTVDVINYLVMDKFPGHSREHRSFESVETDAHLNPTEFLN